MKCLKDIGSKAYDLDFFSSVHVPEIQVQGQHLEHNLAQARQLTTEQLPQMLSVLDLQLVREYMKSYRNPQYDQPA